MGRRKKIDIEREAMRNHLEEQFELAESLLSKYGNASLGMHIIRNLSPEKAADILTQRTGRDISVRRSVHEGPVHQGKRYPDEVYYIAEDNGPLIVDKIGQISLF